MKEKIRKGFFVFGILILAAGLGLAMYATVNNWYCEYRAGNEIENYTNVIRNTSRSVLNDLKYQSTVYNESLTTDEEAVSSVSYDDMLAATDAIGYLEIPKLHLRLPIYEGTDEEVLAKGVGHMQQTSLPTGGESTHCVLAGHTGLPTAKLFTHLDEMQEGDLFYIYELDETLTYKVDKISVVFPDETDELQIVDGKDYVTLLTCIPYGVNSHRLLVRGERTETPTQIQDTKDAAVGSGWHYAVLSGAILLILVLAVWGIKHKRRREDENE